MSQITFKGDAVHTEGVLPQVGTKAPDSVLTDKDLNDKKISEFSNGKKVILNIFPSLNTGVCADSVRNFNDKATALQDTIVLCVSKDLPFAQAKFYTDEKLENIVMLSDFRNNFGKEYELIMSDGPLKGLLSRAVVVLDKEGQVLYTEQVSEIGHEPNYSAALDASK